jgi:hypothetical protein
VQLQRAPHLSRRSDPRLTRADLDRLASVMHAMSRPLRTVLNGTSRIVRAGGNIRGYVSAMWLSALAGGPVSVAASARHDRTRQVSTCSTCVNHHEGEHRAMTSESSTNSWRIGTRVLRASDGDPLVTMVFDDPAVAEQIDDRGDPVDAGLERIEILASFVGPTRSTAEVVGEILVVVQQVGLGAAGSGLWAGVQALLEKVVRRRHADDQPDEASSRTETQHIVTVMIPTERGPALVHRVTVGALDLDAERFSVERIVQYLIDGPASPQTPSTTSGG